MTLELYREKILKRFGPQDMIKFSLGEFDGDWAALERDVQIWWDFYKKWEAGDTIAKAFAEQRLTVKGGDKTWSHDLSAPDRESTSAKTYPKPPEVLKGPAARMAALVTVHHYPLKKGLDGINDRLDPRNFVPPRGGESRKTELGLHDVSAGLMHNRAAISTQQYKTPDNTQYFIFMPLSHAGDQAVFQNINTLAKANREQRTQFYDLVRGYRSKMTRLKLAAEHDMATNFVCVGRTPAGRPKFKFTLLEKTDASVRDQERGLVGPDVKFVNTKKPEKAGDPELGAKVKVMQVPTTPGILEARRLAAINFQSLVLGEMLRYGEVTVAYRSHDGGFPKFAQFNSATREWKVGKLNASGQWKLNVPAETFPDMPTL